MADQEIPIFDFTAGLDTSAFVRPSRISDELTLTGGTKNQACIVMADPGASNAGFDGSWKIPQNYASTPRCVIEYLIDGTPAAIVAFGLTQIAREDVSGKRPFDTAYEAEDLDNKSAWGGYSDEDIVSQEITITPAAAYTAAQRVFFAFFIDGSVHTFTGNILLVGLNFKYTQT